ncbi:MAG: response regulator [Proteobacteria bacterium]|nr:response regulator [Pseudomonadota bacterium]
MNQTTILLIEDNPDDVELTLHAFQKNHMANDVVVAGDGAEGLDYLFGTGKYAGRDADDPPALILLDLQLPKIGGLEVLRRVREDERTKRIPVVIMTTSDEEEDIANGYDGGANSYLRKPVDFAEFMNAVKQLEMYWMVLNTPPPR